MREGRDHSIVPYARIAVTAKHAELAWIGAGRGGVADDLRERGHIAQPEVEALPSHRMQCMRGVAYYREIARGQIRGDTTGRL